MYSKLLNSIIADYLAPVLQEQRFRRYKLTWNRRIGDLANVLDVQLNRRNAPTEVDFTINIGIWSEAVWRIYSGGPAPTVIREVDCFPRFRIGMLLANFDPDTRDVWWSIRTAQDADRVGEEVREILSQRCVPFFDRFSSIYHIKAFCDRTPNLLFPADELSYAILDYLTEDFEGYERIMREFDNEGFQHWHRKVREIRTRLREYA